MLSANGWRVLLIGLGTLVVPLDTAVNIAFPAITRAFDLPVAMIQWVVICYVLTYASLMLALGRIGDLFGYALVFRLGLAWSVVAYLLCAVAPSLEWLLVFRGLQGVGAALVLSCGPALATSLFPEDSRARVLGVYTMMSSIGSALGPSLGGMLVERFGWEAVFWFRAPIALVALLLLRGLPARQPGAREAFDLVGAVLFALSLAAALLTVNRARLLGDGDWSAVVTLAVTVLYLAGFIRRELGTAKPMLNLRVFAVPGFALVNVGNALVHLAGFAVLLLVPFHLARIEGLSVPVAGLLLGCNGLGMIVASPLSGWLAGRVAPRRILAAGAATACLGLSLTGSWGPNPALPWMAISLLLQGFGMGLFQVAYMDVVTGTIPRADRGVAGSLTMLTRTIGVVSSATLLSLLFQSLRSSGSSFDAAFATTLHLAAALPALVALVALLQARAR